MQQTTLHEAWLEAFDSADDAELLSLYHPHAVVESPMGRWHGVEAIREMLAEAPLAKWRQHAVVATKARRDEIAMVTHHGYWMVEHRMQVTDGLIRAHKFEFSPEPSSGDLGMTPHVGTT